jgi:hypothetical protein
LGWADVLSGGSIFLGESFEKSLLSLGTRPQFPASVAFELDFDFEPRRREWLSNGSSQVFGLRRIQNNALSS